MAKGRTFVAMRAIAPQRDPRAPCRARDNADNAAVTGRSRKPMVAADRQPRPPADMKNNILNL